MRKIKFRVWHPEDWTSDDQPILGMTMDWAFEDYAPLNDLLSEPGEHVVFMQFTGLIDKDGKEIYESDLLSDGKFNWLVSWNEDHACFQMACKNIIAEIIDNLNMKVVGNLYLNPELING
jgi:YopX protein